MKFFLKPVYAATSLLLMISVFLTACDVTSSNDHDDHSDPVGFVIEQNSAEILRFENNTYTWNPSESWDEYFREDADGIVISLEVIELTDENPRGMTPSVRVRWIDEDGEVFDLPDLSEEDGGEFWLSWEWGKPNVLAGECSPEAREDLEAIQDGTIRPVNLEQHEEEDGQWGFHFRADHAGEDQIRFRLMHGFGDAAHSDFTSGWMDVTVPNDEHELIDEHGVYQHNREKCRTR